MNQSLNRWAPKLPVTAMQTFTIATPQKTHFRKATCKEVDCEHYLKGWSTTVLIDSPEEELLKKSGRKWRAVRVAKQEGCRVYYFGEGQKCFRGDLHQVPLEREPIHVVRAGDWRGNPTGRRSQLRADQWLNSFQESIAEVTERKERG